MHLCLVLSLVAVAGVIALPVTKIDLDPQMAVEGKLEAREPQVSLLCQVQFFLVIQETDLLIDELQKKLSL